MKKTNKCEICGKRYKLPFYDIAGELREDMCFTCEMAINFMATVEVIIEKQYGPRYSVFAKTYVDYLTKKIYQDDKNN